jgi:hypothetical protein
MPENTVAKGDTVQITREGDEQNGLLAEVLLVHDGTGIEGLTVLPVGTTKARFFQRWSVQRVRKAAGVRSAAPSDRKIEFTRSAKGAVDFIVAAARVNVKVLNDPRSSYKALCDSLAALERAIAYYDKTSDGNAT